MSELRMEDNVNESVTSANNLASNDGNVAAEKSLKAAAGNNFQPVL